MLHLGHSICAPCAPYLLRLSPFLSVSARRCLSALSALGPILGTVINRNKQGSALYTNTDGQLSTGYVPIGLGYEGGILPILPLILGTISQFINKK